MIYTSDLEEYLRLRQLFQLSGEQVNYHPGISATQPPVHSTEWSLYNPSMSHASESLDPNWSMHTTIGHPTPDNLYQSTMQSSSTMEHRPTEDGIEDRPNPSQTTNHIQSSAPNPSTQETSPNENNIGVADMQASSPQRQGASDRPFKCLWDGCKSRRTSQRETFSSHASLMRHIKVQHVAHRPFKCPECDRRFGRLDNMKEHRGRCHRMYD
ncbi:unnamed protein product [Penicillium nalgiovense]|nr:unnamed protein product [Penicillium nalgiovense]